MTDPPSPKRQRINDNESDENESKKVKQVLEKVQNVEEELEQMNVEQAKEILNIEAKYNAKKHSTYVKRNKLLTEIPYFWKTVVRAMCRLNELLACVRITRLRSHLCCYDLYSLRTTSQ